MLAKISLTDAKRRVLDRLKRADAATVPELAGALRLTETAVRQHLETLAEAVRRSAGASPRSRSNCSPTATTTSPSN